MLVFVGGGTTDGNLPVRYAKAHDQRSETENAGNLKVCKLTNPIPLILNTPLETMV